MILKNIHLEINLMISEQTTVSLCLSIPLLLNCILGDDSMKKLNSTKELLDWVIIAPINLCQ